MTKSGILFGIAALAVGIYFGTKVAPKVLAWLPKL